MINFDLQKVNIRTEIDIRICAKVKAEKEPPSMRRRHVSDLPRREEPAAAGCQQKDLGVYLCLKVNLLCVVPERASRGLELIEEGRAQEGFRGFAHARRQVRAVHLE